MNKVLTILGLMTIACSSFAGTTLKCSVELLGTENKSEVLVQANQGLAPIELGDGKTLRIVLFNDEVRFTALRALTDAERAEANKGPGQPFVEGKIVAYSQVRAKGEVSLAMFVTPDVKVFCAVAE